MYSTRLKKSGSRLPRVELEEMGPSIDFEIRRSKEAARDVMREAMKVPRALRVISFFIYFLFLNFFFFLFIYFFFKF